MLAMRGNNPGANVLHVIVGPETELFTDIHGAKVCDISEILTGMDGNKPVFLSLTRCKSEAFTAASLSATGAGHVNSFNGKPMCSEPGSPVLSGQSPSGHVAPEPDNKQATPGAPNGPVAGVQVELRCDRCDYCGQTGKALMPIAEPAICVECGRIELGRLKDQDKKRVDKLAGGA